MATTVNINKIIQVNATVTNTEFTSASMAGVLLSENPLIPFNALQTFTSIDAVATYFGTTSDEYIYASNYFTSYTGTINTPPFIVFSLYVTAAIAPFTRGASLTSTDLANLKTITAGTLTVNFDSTPVTTATIDLASYSSFSAMATAIEAALVTAGLTDATVVYDSITKAFTIGNGVTGSTSTVNYCSVSSLATYMKVTQNTGALLSQGSDALTPADNLNNITAQTNNWATFTNLFSLVSEEEAQTYMTVLAFAAWLATQNNQYAYVLWSTQTNLTIPGNTSNVAYALVDAGYGSVTSGGQITYNVPIMPNYSLQDLACGIMGTAAGIDYTALNGTISFANKSYAGITPLVTSDTVYDTLALNGFNSYVNFNAKANTYTFTEDGSVGGIFVYFDNLINQLWLADQLQNTTATLFATLSKVPNNPTGLQLIQGAIDGIMQDAIYNGVAQTGNTFDAVTTAALKIEAGYDITSLLFNAGYVIQMIPATSTSRTSRTATANLWYTNGGSINSMTINTNFVF